MKSDTMDPTLRSAATVTAIRMNTKRMLSKAMYQECPTMSSTPGSASCRRSKAIAHRDAEHPLPGGQRMADGGNGHAKGMPLDKTRFPCYET